MTEERWSWAETGEGPSPTNEELFRGAKIFTTMNEFMTWKDAFETDEEHEAFLADLYESRRRV